MDIAQKVLSNLNKYSPSIPTAESAQILENMSIQRQATSILTGVFAVYPKLERVISLRSAKDLISAMAVANMFIGHVVSNDARIFNVELYIKSGINYEFNLRAIARMCNIDESIASKFIRGCFSANEIYGVYPFNRNVYGVEYEHVTAHLSIQLAQYVIEFLAGDQYIAPTTQPAPVKPSKSKARKIQYVSPTDRAREKYGTFYLFKKFAKIKNMGTDIPAKLYFLEVIEYIRNHPDRAVPRGEFSSRKIFIDEIIDYAREYDEARFDQFRDEIANMILAFDDYSVLPNCSDLKSAIKLNTLGDNIKSFDSSFSDLFAHLPQPESPDVNTNTDEKKSKIGNETDEDEGDEQPEFPDVNTNTDEKKSKIDNETEEDDDDEGDEQPEQVDLPTADIIPIARSAHSQLPNLDHQFDDDIRLAILRSLQDMYTQN